MHWWSADDEPCIERVRICPAGQPRFGEAADTGRSGPIAWIRENLFSSIPNTLLTLFGAWLVYVLIPPAIEFLIVDAVWAGKDREACLEPTVGQPVGACWAFRQGAPRLFHATATIRSRSAGGSTSSWLLLAIGIVWLLWPRRRDKSFGALFFFLIFPIIAFFLLTGAPALGLPNVSTPICGAACLSRS